MGNFCDYNLFCSFRNFLIKRKKISKNMLSSARGQFDDLFLITAHCKSNDILTSIYWGGQNQIFLGRYQTFGTLTLVKKEVKANCNDNKLKEDMLWTWKVLTGIFFLLDNVLLYTYIDFSHRYVYFFFRFFKIWTMKNSVPDSWSISCMEKSVSRVQKLTGCLSKHN